MSLVKVGRIVLDEPRSRLRLIQRIRPTIAVAIVLLLAGCVSTPKVVENPPPAPREFRGVWVATVNNIDWPSVRGLPADKQRAEAIAILDKAKALNLNAIIFQVRPAADALGQDLLFQGASEWNVTLQVPVLEAVIARKPDAILIAPTDKVQLVEPLKKAADAGISVFCVDTFIGNGVFQTGAGDADFPLSYIASDNVLGGRIAARALAPTELGRLLIEITVADDGAGLPAEARSEVTRRGRRLDESKPGSGLGLAIVQDLTQLYGGALALEDSPTGGLLVRVTLPGLLNNP